MKVLSGWKEIANHLHQGVRTVQRWELFGLPVHRLKSGVVFAFVEELEAWQQATPMRTRDVIRDLKIKIQHLETEVRSLECKNRKLRKVRKGRKVA